MDLFRLVGIGGALLLGSDGVTEVTTNVTRMLGAISPSVADLERRLDSNFHTIEITICFHLKAFNITNAILGLSTR